MHQDYWRARGSWRPDSWALSFGAFRDGELVGYQGLEGDDFARLRTVDSWSFLTGAARGQGLGKQMRAAVLALAFGALGARFAITSAWTDNHASLAVSRALGMADVRMGGSSGCRGPRGVHDVLWPRVRSATAGGGGALALVSKPHGEPGLGSGHGLRPHHGRPADRAGHRDVRAGTRPHVRRLPAGGEAPQSGGGGACLPAGPPAAGLLRPRGALPTCLRCSGSG